MKKKVLFISLGFLVGILIAWSIHSKLSKPSVETKQITVTTTEKAKVSEKTSASNATPWYRQTLVIVSGVATFFLLFVPFFFLFRLRTMKKSKEKKRDNAPPDPYPAATAGAPIALAEPLPGWLERALEWTAENRLFIIVAFVLLHVLGWLTFSDWWWANVILNPIMWGFQGVLILFALMVPKGKTPFHHMLGKIGIGVTVLCIFIYLVIPTVKANKAEKEAEQAAQNQALASLKNGLQSRSAFGTSAESSSCLMPLNLTVKKEVEEILNNEFASTDPAVLHDKKKLLWLPWHETRFNQNDAEGHVYHRCPTPDNSDTTPAGANQIKPLRAKLCKEKGLDYTKSVRDNEYCAIEIYKKLKSEGKTGFEAWPSVPDDEKVLDEMKEPERAPLLPPGTSVITISPTKWTQINTEGVHRIHCSGNVTVLDALGNVYHDGPGKLSNIPLEAALSFKPETREPVIVELFK